MNRTFRRTLELWWLVLSAHFEAFLFAPRPYLTAAKWWVLGKRVRARAQFTPLLSRGRYAYDLWLRHRGQQITPSASGMPPIIGLIQSTGDSEQLAITIASLVSEQIDAHVIVCESAQEDLQAAAARIDWTSDPWLLPIAAGDRLSPGAARSYREAMCATGLSAIYSDDDRCDRQGRRYSPHFKPDWNAELLRHHDYLTGSCVVRGESEALLAAGQRADWARALIDRAVSEGSGAMHLRQLLHHRQVRPDPHLPLSALSISSQLPRVTVIIPTRNRGDLLAVCLEGIEAADYPSVDVIVVDNDSHDPATLAFLESLPGRSRPGREFRVLRHPGPFNYSVINNRAVREARGELVCLLNNDIEMLGTDWLAILATQALREEVGAVGPQLLYPDGRIQHAGVVIGVGNAAGHAHRFVDPAATGYFRRHALPQFVSAVTGACLLVRRESYLAVDGLDEINFPVAFNDVDLCLRLNARGWQSFYEPRAVLVHHESVSRGFDRDPVGAARFAGELAALQRLWQTDKVFDQFHHPELSRASEQFALEL